MPVAKETAARCQTWVRSEIESIATRAMAANSRVATQSRIRFCGMRSAATPPSRAGSSTPTAPAVETTESWAGPPPIRMTSHTIATTHTPEAKVEKASARASLR
jgi:hypothetical protein